VKASVFHKNCRPVFALINPELAFTLPKYQIAAGAVDVFSHAFERYFYPGNSSIADGFGEAVMRSVLKYSKIAVEQPGDYQAMAELMLASAMAHNDITGMGHGDLGFDGCCHGLERQLGGIFDTTHGEGLSILMPAWMEYIAAKGAYEKQVKFAENVFGVPLNSQNPLQTVREGADRMREWFAQLGLAPTLGKMGIDESGIKAVMDKNFPPGNTQTFGAYYPLDSKDFENIYRSVL
jgi:alcohol dehydrogenase YqhD (iron-dependent ADH family)